LIWRPDEKVIRLANTVEKRNNELVPFSYEEDGIKLGKFQVALVQALKPNGNLFKDKIEGWEKDHPELFKALRKRVEKIGAKKLK